MTATCYFWSRPIGSNHYRLTDRRAQWAIPRTRDQVIVEIGRTTHDSTIIELQLEDWESVDDALWTTLRSCRPRGWIWISRTDEPKLCTLLHPQLRELTWKGPALDERALQAIHRTCPRLETLRLGDAPNLPVDALLPILLQQPNLRTFAYQGTPLIEADKLWKECFERVESSLEHVDWDYYYDRTRAEYLHLWMCLNAYRNQYRELEALRVRQRTATDTWMDAVAVVLLDWWKTTQQLVSTNEMESRRSCDNGSDDSVECLS